MKPLTKYEKEVKELLESGLTNGEVAKTLKRSKASVKNTNKRIRTKGHKIKETEARKKVLSMSESFKELYDLKKNLK